jgi:Esterase-like activity of phytase
LKGIVPILKKPLLDLADLNLPLHNLQGLTLGPRLADGSRSLLLIGDNGRNPEMPTQLVMLRLGSGRSS